MADDGVSNLPADPAKLLADNYKAFPQNVSMALQLQLLQISQAGVMAQQNFVLMNHMLDNEYLSNKGAIDPQEALAQQILSPKEVAQVAANAAVKAASAGPGDKVA